MGPWGRQHVDDIGTGLGEHQVHVGIGTSRAVPVARDLGERRRQVANRFQLRDLGTRQESQMLLGDRTAADHGHAQRCTQRSIPSARHPGRLPAVGWTRDRRRGTMRRVWCVRRPWGDSNLDQPPVPAIDPAQ